MKAAGASKATATSKPEVNAKAAGNIEPKATAKGELEAMDTVMIKSKPATSVGTRKPQVAAKGNSLLLPEGTPTCTNKQFIKATPSATATATATATRMSTRTRMRNVEAKATGKAHLNDKAVGTSKVKAPAKVTVTRMGKVV